MRVNIPKMTSFDQWWESCASQSSKPSKKLAHEAWDAALRQYEYHASINEHRLRELMNSVRRNGGMFSNDAILMQEGWLGEKHNE
jgi:hypothetical protein